MRQRHKLLWAATLVCNVLLHHIASAGPLFVPQFLSGGTGRNIRHLPCVSRRTGETGVCMFAFTCAKANGTHLGTCIDRFYFGSCCKIDDEPEVFPQDNTIDVDNPLSMSKPFFSSTTKQALDSNDIPGNVDRPRPSSVKPTTGATLITRADPTTTQRTADQTKTKPYKIVTKKPVTLEATTESFRISTFQTVQNASEPRPSTHPTIGTTKRPHNPTTLSLSSTTSNWPRPTSSISSVASSFTTVPPTVQFSTSSASSIRPSSPHWSTNSAASSVRPSSTHWSSTSSNFPHRNITSKRPSPASTTVVTKKPTFASAKPAELITKSPPSTNYVVPTTPKIQTADTSKPSTTVQTSTQKTPTVTRFPPRNATTKTPPAFGTKLSSPSSTTYITTTTPNPTTIKDIEEKPQPSRKPSTKKPTRTTTKRPFTPTKKPISSTFTRRPPSSSTLTTSTTKPVANSTDSVTKTPTTQKSPSTGGKRPSTTWPTKRPLNTTTPTTTTTTTTVSTTPTTAAKTTTTTTTTTKTTTTAPTTTKETTKITTTPTTTTITTKKPLTSTTKIPTTVRRPTTPTATTRRNTTNLVTNQPTLVTSTTESTKLTQKLSTLSTTVITTSRPKITDTTTNKSTTSKISDTITLRPATEKPIKHSSTASVTVAATPSPDVTTPRSTTIYSTTKRTTSSSSTLLPVQNIKPSIQNQTDSSFLASQQNVTSKPWSTSPLTTVSNEVDTEYDSGLSNQTESTPGIVTWTSLADEAETTKTPSTTTDVTETDWTPITTPDGWIFIPSPTTEKSEEEDDLETKPVPVTTETPFVSAKPVTESTTTRRTTTPATTSSTSSSSTTQRTTTQSTTYVDRLSTVATVTVSSEFTESPPTTPSAPLNMSSFKEVCGRRLFPEPKIVGGSPSTFGKWPWQISLRQWRTSTYLHKCGAALLNENWAITAAHCVQNVLPSDLLLRIGEYDLGSEEEPYGFQERRVQIVASHPNFDPRTFEFDLALMRFYEPVLPFQPNILPICVPDDDEDYVGQQAFVTGWGRLYEDGPLPSVLQEVAVPVINNTVCEGMYRNAGYVEHIPHIFICAGWRKGGFDSCEGDSGGPLVIRRKRDSRWVLAGVISWGIGCAEPNQPGVYTRISEFREWINQILQF